MPATRSRNERWKDYLDRLPERGGAIEIALRREHHPANPRGSSDGADRATPDVVWRVRVLSCRGEQLLVEPPAAFGRAMTIPSGAAIVGAMSVGQNRWMFHSRVLGARVEPGFGSVLVLDMPSGVERCARRSFHRISTASLHLPQVRCWPLLDPATALAAETACRARIEARLSRDRSAGSSTHAWPVDADVENTRGDLSLPDVGSPFEASMLNVSGGGLGLRVEPGNASALSAKPYLWLQVDLGTGCPGPLSVTGRVAHTHLDSMQTTYAGIAFEFGHHPEYHGFITNLLQMYVSRAREPAERRAIAG